MTSVETIPIKIVFDRKDASEWQSTNPVIDEGELVVELDTHKLKVGDGKTSYNDLPYYEGPQGESITKVQLSENGDLSVWIGDKETKLGNIKGQKGDRGKGVESARIDESGHLKLKIEEESELDLGNVKGESGPKGDSITITNHKRVSDGTQVSFSDGTQIVVPKGDTGDVNGINLEDYVKKSELKNVGSADVKAINDFLGLSQKVFTSSYSYTDSLLKSYAKPSYSASWYVNESTVSTKNGDKVLITIHNTTTQADNYLEVAVTYVGANYVTATSTGRLLTTPGEVKVVTKKQAEKDYAAKKHKHEISDIAGLNERLSGYLRQADIQSQLNNIGKLKDTQTGQYLEVKVVDKGQVPSNTSGMIVFERS
ncbi:TPA: hypothetical protein VGX90_000914 [Streptococcus pyogenes]|nr:hypothetical protein [Streptococcus pyogenes]